MDGSDAVVHLAARASVPRSLEDPVATHEANATGTLRVLEAARRGGRGAGRRGLVVVGVRRQPRRSRPARTSPRPAEPLRGEQAGGRGVRLWPTRGRSGSPCSCSASSTCSARCSGPATPTRRWSPPSWPPRSRASRSPCTATGPRPATSPTWGACVRVLAEAVDRSGDRPRARSTWPSAGAPRSSSSPPQLGEVLGRPLSLAHGPARAGDVRDSQADQRRLRALFPDVEPVRSSTGCGPPWTGSAAATRAPSPSGSDVARRRPRWRGRRSSGRTICHAAAPGHDRAPPRPRDPAPSRLTALLPDVLGLAWVMVAAMAVLVPALAHGASLGPFDQLSRVRPVEPARAPSSTTPGPATRSR